jgi:hypothetical protein
VLVLMLLVETVETVETVAAVAVALVADLELVLMLVQVALAVFYFTIRMK